MFKWQICYSSQSVFDKPTINLNALRNSRAKITSYSSEFIFTFLYVGSSISKCKPGIGLVYPPFFCKLRSSSNPHKQKSNWVGTGDQNSSISEAIQD